MAGCKPAPRLVTLRVRSTLAGTSERILMGILESVQRWMGKVNPRVMRVVEKGLRSVPGVQGRIDKEYDGLLSGLEASLKPYRKDFVTFSRLPETGRDREEILRDMEVLRNR